MTALRSNTVRGGIMLASGYLLGEEWKGGDYATLIANVANLLIAFGAVVSAYGVWRGQQKVKETVLTKVDPDTRP